MPRETGPRNLIRQTGLASSRLTDDEHESALLHGLPQQGLGIAFHVGRRQSAIKMSVCGVNAVSRGSHERHLYCLRVTVGFLACSGPVTVSGR